MARWPRLPTARRPSCMFMSRGSEEACLMAMARRHLLLCACLGVIFALSAEPALAQEDPAKYPTRPIHIIVGFAAGGGDDNIARRFWEKIYESPGRAGAVE